MARQKFLIFKNDKIYKENLVFKNDEKLVFFVYNLFIKFIKKLLDKHKRMCYN